MFLKNVRKCRQLPGRRTLVWGRLILVVMGLTQGTVKGRKAALSLLSGVKSIRNPEADILRGSLNVDV